MSKADTIAKRFERRYGHKSAATGNIQIPTAVDSTGILSLDYALGTGGWPEGVIAEVFGPPDIGKSSIIGFNGIIEAQKKGKLCGIVAMEPGFDKAWAAKHGVNLDELVIGWPDDGEEAFHMLYDMVMDDDIKFIVFDSIGALLRPTEAGEKGKPSAGGQSALITWGVKRIATPTWKRRKTVILLNQIRDDMNARVSGVFDSPGGHALKHMAEIRIQLRPGADRYNIREGSGKEAHDVMVGRSVVAVIKRTKKDEGTNKRAVFDFYQKETDTYPFGVDKILDIYNTAKRTGVIRQSGAYYSYEEFPDGRIYTEDAVLEWLRNNNLDKLREAVLGKVSNGQDEKN